MALSDEDKDKNKNRPKPIKLFFLIFIKKPCNFSVKLSVLEENTYK